MTFSPTPSQQFPGWFEIPGYSQYLANEKGFLFNKKTKYSTKGGNAGRYLKVSVYRDGDNVATLQHVHDLVCRAFHGLPEEGLVVKHKNDKRWDNRPTNLEWGTQSDNMKETYSRGIRKPTYGPRVSKEEHEEEASYQLGDLVVTESQLRDICDTLSVTYLPPTLLGRLPNAHRDDTRLDSVDIDNPIVLFKGDDNKLRLVDGYYRLGQHIYEESINIPVFLITERTLEIFGFSSIEETKPLWTDW